MDAGAEPFPNRCRIALTGGPGGGKTTAADLYRREIGERVVIVPEAATLLFGGGFPRARVPLAMRAAQSAIYPERILLCDRGTIDGAVYWPDGDEQAFFAAQGTTLAAELARYEAVIFFETAAAGGISIEGGNPVRNESLAEALALDHRLRAVWSQHPHFVLVRHEASFFHKMRAGLDALSSVVLSVRNGRRDH